MDCSPWGPEESDVTEATEHARPPLHSSVQSALPSQTLSAASPMSVRLPSVIPPHPLPHPHIHILTGIHGTLSLPASDPSHSSDPLGWVPITPRRQGLPSARPPAPTHTSCRHQLPLLHGHSSGLWHHCLLERGGSPA